MHPAPTELPLSLFNECLKKELVSNLGLLIPDYNANDNNGGDPWRRGRVV